MSDVKPIQTWLVFSFMFHNVSQCIHEDSAFGVLEEDICIAVEQIRHRLFETNAAPHVTIKK